MKVILSTALLSICVLASPAAADQAVYDPALADRLEQLEKETQALRQQVQVSQRRYEQLANTMTTGAPENASDEYFTFDELRQEMKRLAWTKGPFRIVPYGYLWGSAIYATRRTSPGPYTLWVFADSLQGEDAFVIDTRRTRVGLDIAGPRIWLFQCAESSAKVEIDFHGAFLVENKPGVLLRHAYGEIKNEYFNLLAGQTWDVISPLNPGTISYSVGWAGGNIGYRRAQVRLERFLSLGERSQLTVQMSMNQNIISDFAAAGDGINPEASGWPVMQGRLAWTLSDVGPDGLPVTFGVSGHIGEQSFDINIPDPNPANPPLLLVDDLHVKTWSVNADVRLPLTEHFGFQGEFFTGSSLSTFLGGVVQGEDLDLVGRRFRGIRSTGGWFEVWYDWTTCLHSHIGYGLDDPLNSDITRGRTYNQFIFANLIYDVTDKMNLGIEVTDWTTNHKLDGQGESVTLEFSGRYAF